MALHLFLNEQVVAVAVYLEMRKSRKFVGLLRYDSDRSCYDFTYDKQYIYAKNVIPVGPELPLTQIKHQSNRLFPSFVDRIPSKENPAYPDYCRATGIDPDESDPLILLATIGKKGPSSFVFEPIYLNPFDAKLLKSFRLDLGLTTREFSEIFAITHSSLIKIEKGKLAGAEILKRMEIFWRFPAVTLDQILRHGGAVHEDKRKALIIKMKKQIAQNKTHRV